MKVFSTIMKVLVALAAVAGAVYVVATYGDKIVAWAKGLLGKCCCNKCCDEGDCCCDEEACCCDEEACCCEEAPAEEAAAAEEAVQAEDADFEA